MMVVVPLWPIAALPLLAGALYVMYSTGNLALLVAWAVMTVVWLGLVNFIGKFGDT
jgi:hypothetical protein